MSCIELCIWQNSILSRLENLLQRAHWISNDKDSFCFCTLRDLQLVGSWNSELHGWQKQIKSTFQSNEFVFCQDDLYPNLWQCS